jgi:hypothetical protein
MARGNIREAANWAASRLRGWLGATVKLGRSIISVTKRVQGKLLEGPRAKTPQSLSGPTYPVLPAARLVGADRRQWLSVSLRAYSFSSDQRCPAQAHLPSIVCEDRQALYPSRNRCACSWHVRAVVVLPAAKRQRRYVNLNRPASGWPLTLIYAAPNRKP